MRFFATLILIQAIVVGSASAQIYADFETSLGNFTCELNYTAAPKTVANFVGLAEGSKAWIDPLTGNIKENVPFYDGLVFHRVIAGFMNQGGCPLGTGTSGPGYSFPDETSNGLSHVPYVISMANSGPNTNGSQFFVTVPLSYPHSHSQLDGVHTVFGSVISGSSVIDTINATPKNGERPATPVVIHHVGIRRVGAAAQAFNISAQNLTTVRGSLPVNLELQTGASGSTVSITPKKLLPGGTLIKVHRSTDLTSWEEVNRETYLVPGPDATPLMIVDEATPGGTPLPAKAFYRLAEIYYPETLGPVSMAGKTMTVAWADAVTNYSMVFSFDGGGQGGTVTYSASTGSVPISSVVVFPKPFSSIITIHTIGGLGSLAVDAMWKNESATNTIGRHRFLQYQRPAPELPPRWVQISSGNVTVTK